MSRDFGAFDPEQLSALQTLFDGIWIQLTNSKNVDAVQDWSALRDKIAFQVMELSRSNLTDNEIIQAILSSLGLQ
jgi:hypothetical protein